MDEALQVHRPHLRHLVRPLPALSRLGRDLTVLPLPPPRGIVTVCTAAVKTYEGLIVARIFLGITEAGEPGFAPTRLPPSPPSLTGDDTTRIFPGMPHLPLLLVQAC